MDQPGNIKRQLQNHNGPARKYKNVTTKTQWTSQRI